MQLSSFVTVTRRCLPLTCFFKLPEQGMKDYEVLSRGTAFLSDSHILASHHVVEPFHFPNYFTEDWLQFVTPQHCRYVISLPADVGGDVLLTSPISDPNSRDVAALALANPTDIATLSQWGASPLRLHNDDSFKGDKVIVDGFEVTELRSPLSDDFFNNIDDDRTTGDTRIHLHSNVAGFVVSNNLPDQHFAMTPIPLTDGYCGAPICPDVDNDDPDFFTYIGIVEGIVNNTASEEVVRGAASYIPAPYLKTFLEHVEKTRTE